MKTLATLVLFAAAASQVGATDCGQITRDPGFDLWCGDTLCAWKTERGQIARVATWNEGDPGVELVGDDSAIEQLTPVNYTDTTCIEFDLIANVEETAEVYFNVDVDDDGVLEQMERLPTSDWKPLSYLIKLKAPYSGVRFELAKRGSGHAVLAQLEAKSSDKCGDISVLDPGPQPDGEPCNVDADCASAKCRMSPFPTPVTGFLVPQLACEGCDDTSCGSGSASVCGAGVAGSPVRAVPTACVAPASAALGEECATGAECASGICADHYCSTCDAGHACGSGGACGPAWDVPFAAFTPLVCGPGLHAAPSGAPCAADDECFSRTCHGSVRMQCSDGRACTNNAECPFGDGSDALHNGACVTVGVQGGSCQ